jgi:hypothetical protein
MCPFFLQGQEVADQIVSSCPKSPQPEVVHVDLSSLQSVRTCSKELLGKLTCIDYLINNAGQNVLKFSQIRVLLVKVTTCKESLYLTDPQQLEFKISNNLEFLDSLLREHTQDRRWSTNILFLTL